MATKIIFSRHSFLLPYRRNPRQFLSFDVFEEGAAAGGDVADLVCQAELVDGCHGVAAADEREGAFFRCEYNGFSHGTGTFGKLRNLENAYRTIPQNRGGIFNDAGKLFTGSRTDIQPFPAVRDVHRVANHGMGIVAECVAGEGFARKHEVHALFLGNAQDVQCQVKFVGLADGLAHMSAEGSLERIGHAAAENQIVHFVHEVHDDVNLRGHFRTAHDGSERAFRVFHHVVHGVELALHDIAEHLVVGEVSGP